MPASPRAQEPALPAFAAAMEASIRPPSAMRPRVAPIPGDRFAFCMAGSKLVLMAGLHAMWLGYSVARFAGYGAPHRFRDARMPLDAVQRS